MVSVIWNMATNGDRAEVHQTVTAGQDAYVAGRDMIVNPFGARTRNDDKELAELVLEQAQKKRSQLIGTDFAGDDTANVRYTRRVTDQLRDAGGSDEGDLKSILEYYQALSPRRLVIVGEPGAGKTVLLLELQICLLEKRRENRNIPVPVLVSAPACDVEMEWDDWLAEQISLQFSFPRRRANKLVSRQRILPLVDGLDEMDPATLAGESEPERAEALVRALNESMRGRERAPVVVACRRREYDRLTEKISIDKATQVELTGLSGEEAAAYLKSQFRDKAERDRWSPVLEKLEQEPDGPLARELATPWRLTQAVTAFRGKDKHPTGLFPGDLTGSAYSAYVDKLLFTEYLPSAVRLHRKNPRYTEPKVRRWLVNLAAGLAWQLRDGRSAADITLHEWRGNPGKWAARFPYAILMLLLFMGSSLILSYTDNEPTNNAVLVTMFALGASGSFFPWARGSRSISNENRRAARPMPGLATGLANGIATGVAYGLAIGFANDFPSILTNRITLGLTYGLAAGLAAGFSAGITSKFASGLATGLATWLAYGLAACLAGVLSLGLTNGLTTGITSGLAFGLANGFTYGFAAGIVAGLTSRLTNFSPKTRRPGTIIRVNGLIGLVGGIAIATVFELMSGIQAGLITGISFGLNHGITPGLAADFTAGFASGLKPGFSYVITTGLAYGILVWFAISARIWVRYHLSVAWNCFRGQGPLRFESFLRWAASAGLLRESGIAYQFRHRQLQDWLASAEGGEIAPDYPEAADCFAGPD